MTEATTTTSPDTPFTDFETVPISIPDKRKDVKKKLKIVCLSDTHNKHTEFGKLPEGDVLINTGKTRKKKKLECSFLLKILSTTIPFEGILRKKEV